MTVPVAPLPPVTVLGEMVNEATDSGGVTVSPTEPPAPVQPPTLAIVARREVSLARVLAGEELLCDTFDRALAVTKFLLDASPSWLGQ